MMSERSFLYVKASSGSPTVEQALSGEFLNSARMFELYMPKFDALGATSKVKFEVRMLQG